MDDSRMYAEFYRSGLIILSLLLTALIAHRGKRSGKGGRSALCRRIGAAIGGAAGFYGAGCLAFALVYVHLHSRAGLQWYLFMTLTGLVCTLFFSAVTLLLCLWSDRSKAGAFAGAAAVFQLSLPGLEAENDLIRFSPYYLLRADLTAKLYDTVRVGPFSIPLYPFLTALYLALTAVLIGACLALAQRRAGQGGQPSLMLQTAKVLDGAQLKMIACGTMLLDHVGAVLLEGVDWLYAPRADLVLRSVGRIAFPLFCFGLVEGFFHTRSKRAYALRLLFFALISEIPFDLAVSGKAVDVSYQNVMFQLLVSLLMIWGIDRSRRTLLSGGLRLLLSCACIAAALLLTECVLRCDYGQVGTLLVLGFYLAKGCPALQAVNGMADLIWTEPSSALSFLLCLLYNGKRGKQHKYLFYLFYPAHLLALYLAARLLRGY